MQCTQLEAAPGNVRDANDSLGSCRSAFVSSCRPRVRAPAVPQIDLTYSTWLLPISIGFQVGRVLCRLGWLRCTQMWFRRPKCLHQAAGSRHTCSAPSPLVSPPAPTPRQVSDLDWSWACIVDLVAGAFFAAELVLGFHTRQAGRGRRLVEGGACTLQWQSVASRSVASCWRHCAVGASRPCLAVVPCYCAACSDAAFSFHPTLPTATACPMPGRRGRCGAAGRWRATICCTAPSCKTC